MKRATLSSLPLLLVVTQAAAQPAANCGDAVTQLELNMCAAADYEAADAALNRVWKQARAFARELDAGQDERLKGAENALLAAQRGWIAYRDGHCTLAGFDARGGSMEPMLVSGCLAANTRLRTQELQQFVSGEPQ